MQQRKGLAWATWKKLISEQSGSGQSIALFCRARGVPAWQFFAWNKQQVLLADAYGGYKGVMADNGITRAG